jgi:membrane protease YdiL (CAAX protease family)
MTVQLSPARAVDRASVLSNATHTIDIVQYSRMRVLAVWAAAAVPMGVLAWVVAPVLAGVIGGPVPMLPTLLTLLTVGLVWQFVLVVVLLRRERVPLRWSAVRNALWLRAPRDPRSGRSGGWLWLVLLPLLVAFAATSFVPTLPHAADRDIGLVLATPAGQAFFAQAWGWFALSAALALFNTVLGEELLFRGLLLPRMNGAFGRWDWVANGALFAAYHLHVPWVIPSAVLAGFVLAYPAKRFQSALVSIVVHSSQAVIILGLTISLVLR